MSAKSKDPVLVTTATGQQGGATIRALLADGTYNVRAMVRDPNAPKAKALVAAGAQVVVGNFDNPISLRAACAGVRVVFSMQSPVVGAAGVDWSKERAQSENLVAAALAERVPTYVHTSSSGVGAHRDAPGWQEGRWASHAEYFENKLYACELVRNAGFENWTVILLSTFMNHPMIDPATFIDGRRLVTVVRPDRQIALIAPDDIGRAAAAAMNDPDRFRGVDLHLAGELLTLPQVVEVLSRLDNKDYVVEAGTVEESVAAGLHPNVAQGMTLLNVLNVPARPEIARSYGLSPMSFETWARMQRGMG